MAGFTSAPTTKYMPLDCPQERRRLPQRLHRRHTTATATATATPGPIQLQGKGKKVGGINTSRLKWRGATSANIDVYRDGVVIATTPNDGLYDDSTGTTGQASFMYKACVAGSQTCSNTVVVTFPQ